MLTSSDGYAVVVQLYWNGAVVFLPNEEFRSQMREYSFLAALSHDVRFVFKSPYALQVPSPSPTTKLLQLLVPIARSKWELGWLIQDLEEKRCLLEKLLVNLETSWYKDQILTYQVKLAETTALIYQANQLLMEYEQYISQIEIAIKILDDNPEVPNSFPDSQKLIQRLTLLKEEIRTDS